MIYLDRASNLPIYEQVYQGIRQEILDGTLKCNETLLPIRKMADELHVSKNTVDRAYQQLIAEAYVRSVRGGGYFVEKLDLDFPVAEPEKVASTKVCGCECKGGCCQKVIYDFRYESINSAAFPWNKWRKYVQNALAKEESGDMISYDSNKGNLELRQALCTYLRKHRGVDCDVDQIVVFAGTQFAIQSLMGILPKHSYRVGFEEPGYDGMKNIFLQSDNKVIPVDLTGDGIDMAKLHKSKCDLVYLTPSRQFPTGQTMSLEKRLELLEWAEEHNAFVIENDYDNEFRYGQKRLPSMQALDKTNRVIYLSTLTKVLSPSIRCAYMILPKSLLVRYEEKYKFFNTALPSYHQIAIADFINDDILDKHSREMSVINGAKYDLIKNLIAKNGRGEISLVGTPAGSHTLIKIRKSQNQLDTLEYLQSCGINIQSTIEYWDNPKKAPQDIFLLGYNSLGQAKLKRALVALIKAVRDW